MTHTRFTIGLIAAAGALTVLAVAAQSEEGHGGPGRDRVMMFEEIDADGNGEITLEEMTLHRAERFTGADTDQDGKLSRAELEARAFERMQARVERMLKRHDTDGDGLLSPDELGKPDRRRGCSSAWMRIKAVAFPPRKWSRRASTCAATSMSARPSRRTRAEVRGGARAYLRWRRHGRGRL